ncbi:inorganic pyrophosphatase [candidate division CPR3 bacterium 4484_211]|uniref:Inorganic pyrophosphatase n=1 Tax=candidate division CPR3 bacterium 4484_211 TaxID=1968527 RepID=A0A1W9NZ92_UNCC3|nr:MAG: inorganic pyrophosphatase [candidate division CPR3 bacterium 4484_211]
MANLKDLSPGKNAPNEVNVVIEIPQDSSIKYEVDEESGAIFVDRFLHTAMNYPFNYGFIPQTKAQDGDPMDVLVISKYPAAPGTVITACPVGMLNMEDEAGQDEKIVAVPRKKVDPEYGAIADINDLPEIIKRKIVHFFEHYKDLEEGKWVKVKGWKSKEEAIKLIQHSLLQNQEPQNA